ncbi:MAG TPA: NAD-dependent epimerase/dehydratase family protein [Chitinophagaceae bacterium]|jgi:uncharacterized protein YbjT (DUF2867 family)|nr:NAD-dependent epimerase/dehydratase family protein [Chitinophagaceae bacterium]
MRIVILGASGQIGQAIGLKLKQDGLEVTGTSRRAGGDSDWLKFDPFRDDWQQLGKPDVIINCIGAIREKRSAGFAKVHAGLTRLILHHREQLGHPRILQLSSLGASPAHPVPFLRTKGVADELLLQQERTTVLRPSIVCTPGTMLIQKLRMLRSMARLCHRHLIVPKGFLAASIQPVLISDLVALVAELAVRDHPVRLLHVVGPEPVRYRQLLDLACPGPCSYHEWNEAGVRRIVRYGIGPFFPFLITYDQYRLLFFDNTACAAEAEKILGRKMNPTADFWRAHLSYGQRAVAVV